MKGSLVFSYVLAGLIVLGYFGIVVACIFKAIPETNNNLLYIAIGGLITSFVGIVQYFYGSSLGSKEKNQMLADKPPVNTPTTPTV